MPIQPSGQTFKIAIVGGGAAGITVAAQLSHKISPDQIVVIDPAQQHYYQPLWTLVGAGVLPKEQTARLEKSLIPQGVQFIQEAITTFVPEENCVETDQNNRISYEFLIVAPGLQLNWDGIKGLKEAIGKNGVVSNYSYEYVDSTWEALQNFNGGNAIFTHPNTPIKCGGAPQKIMYLADDYFRRTQKRENARIIFYTANEKIFPVEKYAHVINQVIERKGIETKFKHHLIEIIAEEKKAVFEHLGTGNTEIIPYEMLHVTPPMSAPRFIRDSPLSDASGWVDVDKFTLQHKKYVNIFSLGDVINAPPTTKTGAAVRKQAPVVTENLLSLMSGQPLEKKYDGYSSCPLVTGYGKVILTEFDYALQPKETFPFDQAKERYSMYLLKRDVLPKLYWKGMLRGWL